jgi:hypothetical protein
MPTFDLSQYDELQKWLEEGMEDGVKEGLLSAGYRLLGVIVNEIIPAEKQPPIFDGAYRAAWKVEPTDQGADVYNDMPYAGVIEEGARAENVKPGRAMIDALTEWARRKGLTGHAREDRASPEARTQARSIAWAIARSMQQKGIFNREGEMGLHIARKGMARAADFVEEEVRNAVRKHLK